MQAEHSTVKAEATAEDISHIARLFDAQKRAYLTNSFPSYDWRISQLDKIITIIEQNDVRFAQAVSDDFGNRSFYETQLSDIFVTLSAARQAKKNLRRWMRPRGVPTPLHMMPAISRLTPQPLGVVGVMAPWNYPVNLALGPAVAAIAAGNRVLIKPSELTPRTTALIAELVSAVFDESECAVVTGGPETGAAFAATPFDHLFFTGSTAVGRRVAEAAAKNLTPVTLELGGKSPVIIDESADLEQAAKSIAHGKLFNGGQTCIAPDYVLAPAGIVDALSTSLLSAAQEMFPQVNDTTDYASVVSDGHFARLQALIDDARGRGCDIRQYGDGAALAKQRKIPLTLIIDPPADADVMHEEIFGPVLPILSIANSSEAIDHINARPHPLALYWFGRNKAVRDSVLMQTISGGVSVNATLLQFAQDRLPFGGVGDSGMGAYHGEAGFETFSHLKPVLYQSRLAPTAMVFPPYGDKIKRVLSWLRNII